MIVLLCAQQECLTTTTAHISGKMWSILTDNAALKPMELDTVRLTRATFVFYAIAYPSPYLKHALEIWRSAMRPVKTPWNSSRMRVAAVAHGFSVPITFMAQGPGMIRYCAKYSLRAKWTFPRSSVRAIYTPSQEFLECAGIDPVEPTGAAAITAPFYVAVFIIAIIGIFI